MKETTRTLEEAIYELDSNYESAFCMLNGAKFISSRGIEFVGLDGVNDDEGKSCHWKVRIEQDQKIGQVMDRVPFGILNKAITGLGATRLEIMNQERNSIIVVPTKSLAYSKYKSVNSIKGEDYAFYVGSPIKEIKNKVSSAQIQRYLQNSSTAKKKFLVVADSLPFLIKILEDNKIDVYHDYFLMVDEIDTMQADSAYRPRLENVMDYYFKFDRQQRSVVSATLIDFSNPQFKFESKVTVCWEENPRRNIDLVYTNYVDDVAKGFIKQKLETSPNEKILIAYNSLDGILNILNMLRNENIVNSSDLGILCSERSNDKIKEYLEDTDNVIDEGGHLQKRIVFMTCAYFAGIDILDQCHLITISSHLQPFTYLSTQRMTQIAGRCRNGNLSEIIIYDIPQNLLKSEFKDKFEYQSYLVRKAEAYADFLNSTRNAIINNKELQELESFINSFVDFSAKAKVDSSNYPIKIVRQNCIDKKFIPAYFNIDSLTEKWELIYSLYSEVQNLYNELENQGHHVHKILGYCVQREEHNTTSIEEIKERNAERRAENIARLKQRLLEWHSGGRDETLYNELFREQDKKVQDLCMEFKKLSPYIDAERLFNDLSEKYNDGRTLRNYVNAVVFHIMPNDNAFRADVLAKFNYHSIQSRLGQRGVGKVTAQEKINKLGEVFRVQLRKTDINNDTLAEYFSCFFKIRRSGGMDKIISLNPLNLPVPTQYVGSNINLFDLFLFPE